MRFPDRIGQIVSAVAKACAPTPVTAKIRLGSCRDAINAADVAQAVEDAGGAALTVHGRTTADMFRGSADWEEISRIKPFLYRIPLIGNGDLDHAGGRRRGLSSLRYRRRDDRPGGAEPAVVLCPGRGCAAGEPVPPEPTLAEQRELMLDHYRLIVSRFGERQGTVHMRKIACCYINGCPGVGLSPNVAKANSAAEFHALVDRYYPVSDDGIARPPGRAQRELAQS